MGLSNFPLIFSNHIIYIYIYIYIILEAKAHITLPIRPLTSHLTNHPSKMNKACLAQLKKQGRTNKLRLSDSKTRTRQFGPKFVAASHQTRVDTRSMTRRSIKVGSRGGDGRARVEARTRLDYDAARPPEGGPAEAEGLTASNLPMLDCARTSVGRPARIYLYQLRADTRCILEDLLAAMDDWYGRPERIRGLSAVSQPW